MTTSSAPKMEAKAEWKFEICADCPNPTPHGYFHDVDGEPASDPFFSMSSAIDAMMSGLKLGIIPAENEEALTAQVRASGLPEVLENDPHAMKPIITIPLDELLKVLLVEVTIKDELKSPFTFVVEDKEEGPVAHFLSATGSKTIPINSKAKAREFIAGAVDVDLMDSDEASKLLDEIEASRLPEG